MNSRTLIHVIESMPTSDGAGVKLRRSLGSQRGLHVDPFLMLDEFYSDNPDDYIAGFPAREIPVVKLPRGGEVKIIAGTLTLNGGATSGPVNSGGAKLSTDPLYL